MTKEERFTFLDYVLFLAIIVIFAIFSFIFQVNQIFGFDQTQMLVKGYHAALTGEYLPFGNEASTTGNLPGSLSSFVIGFPFKVYFDAYSPVYFQIFLRIIAVLFFANGLAQLFSRKIVLLGTFFFALSTWTLMQGMLYNPAYLPLGACAFFCGLTHIRNDSEAHTSILGRIWWSCLCVLGIGWCLQFHFSWPVLLFVAGIMWLRKDIKVSYVGLILGALIVGLSLWPYIQELMLNPTIARSPDGYGSERYIGYGFVHVYPVLKGLLYWFRFGSLLFTQKAIVPEFEYDEVGIWIAILAYAWIGLYYLIGGISVLFSAYCNYFTVFVYRIANNKGRLKFIHGITISSILAVLIAAGLNTLTLNYWQIAIIMPFALIPVLTYLELDNRKARRFRPYITIAILFLTASNVLAAVYSSDYNLSVNYRKEIYQNCLIAFNQHQCQPLSEGLNAAELEDAQKTQINPSVILRVIDGIKPVPWNADEEYIEQYKKARQTVRHYKFILPSNLPTPPEVEMAINPEELKKQEAAKAAQQAQADASKATDENATQVSSVQGTINTTLNSARAPNAGASGELSNNSANSNNQAAYSGNKDRDNDVANGSTNSNGNKSSNSSSEQIYVQPATAPIESEAFKPKEGQIVDKSNGANGELVLY